MKVLVTGATGLLGGALLKPLLGRGYEVRCLVRTSSPNISRLDAEQVELAYGDAGGEDSLVRALRGVDAAVHVAGIEYVPQVISAARRVGVGRLMVVSSTSAHSDYEFRSRPWLRMEAMVHESGLEWTVVRPTMVYGTELDKNMHRLLRFLDRSPIFPMFGSGMNLWQPVYYRDVAQGMLAALEIPEAAEENYDLPGAQALTYLELVEVSAKALGRRARILRLPLDPVHRALRAAELARLPLPINSEQVLRLREDKAYSYEKAQRELGYSPRHFAEGIALEVTRLRELGLVRS